MHAVCLHPRRARLRAFLVQLCVLLEIADEDRSSKGADRLVPMRFGDGTKSGVDDGQLDVSPRLRSREPRAKHLRRVEQRERSLRDLKVG